MKVLLLRQFITGADDGSASSDAVGYGQTSARAVRRALEGIGVDVVEPANESHGSKADWLVNRPLEVYRSLVSERPDVALLMHAFESSAAELRRLVQLTDLGTRLVGFVAGSHWDPTDAIRWIHHPGLELLDLADLAALDRILILSESSRDVLLRNIGSASPSMAADLRDRMARVPLPFDEEWLDRHRSERDPEDPPTRILFNHAFTPSKNPELFTTAMDHLLRSGHDIEVLLTRRVPRRYMDLVSRLDVRHPVRVRVAGGLSLEEYAKALWTTDIQVSTASHESLGIATLEAMYTENCCVLPAVGSYPELVGPSSGSLYAEVTLDALIDKLEVVLADRGEQRRQGAELRRRSQLWTSTAVAHRLEAVLQDVCRPA